MVSHVFLLYAGSLYYYFDIGTSCEYNVIYDGGLRVCIITETCDIVYRNIYYGHLN